MSLPVFRLMEKLVVGLRQSDLWPARGRGVKIIVSCLDQHQQCNCDCYRKHKKFKRKKIANNLLAYSAFIKI